MDKSPISRHLHIVKVKVVHHMNYHRMEWACGLAIFFFIIGWMFNSAAFKHFAEFTLAPVAEAFLSKHME